MMTLGRHSPMGSPPLVRERPKERSISKKGAGITPARAGKTVAFISCYSGNKDHPRSCGKDGARHSTRAATSGSPPLVRERLSCVGTIFSYLGITPARAGKTPYAITRSSIIRDHPRSCGKDREKEVIGTDWPGSPPLVRERPQGSLR